MGNEMELWEWAWKVGGPLMVVVVFVGVGTALVLQFFGKHIVIPARDRFFHHLDKVEETLGEVRDGIRELSFFVRGRPSENGMVDDKKPEGEKRPTGWEDDPDVA